MVKILVTFTFFLFNHPAQTMLSPSAPTSQGQKRYTVITSVSEGSKCCPGVWKSTPGISLSPRLRGCRMERQCLWSVKLKPRPTVLPLLFLICHSCFKPTCRDTQVSSTAAAAVIDTSVTSHKHTSVLLVFPLHRWWSWPTYQESAQGRPPVSSCMEN